MQPMNPLTVPPASALDGPWCTWSQVVGRIPHSSTPECTWWQNRGTLAAKYPDETAIHQLGSSPDQRFLKLESIH